MMQTMGVQQQIQELERLRRQKHLWQIGISLTLLLIVVGSLVTLRNAVTGLTGQGPIHDQFTQDLGDRVQKNALPAVEQIGMQAVREVNYQAEVKKLNLRTPELTQAALQQAKLLAGNISQRGKKVLSAAVDRTMKERSSKIKQMFPEATDAQVTALLTALTQEAQTQAVAINDALFLPHQKALDTMVADLTHIEASEAGTIKGQEPTWEMGLAVFDIARADMHDIDAPAAVAAAKKEHKK